MSFRRAGLLGSFAVIAIAFALMPAGALAENPNNHGHHYGQLKHRQPPPAPNPAPATNPPPAASVTSSVHLGTTSNAPAQATIETSQPDATVPLPNPRSVHVAASNPSDGVSWLVLLILPLLAAVWALVFARGALGLARRRRAAAATA